MIEAAPTLEQHLARHLPEAQPGDGDLGALVGSLARAAIRLEREVRRTALAGLIGLAGERNVTGDAQKKLDLVGNETVLAALRETGLVAAVVSEELPDAEPLAGAGGRYVVCVDPLDGSSNTDVNGAVGTIFGVYRRERGRSLDPVSDLLRPGAEQVLAGYVLYGPGTVLVYTAGQGTHGFTLDPERGAFLLSHPSLRCPARGTTYGANLARQAEWGPEVRGFLDGLSAPDRPGGGRARRWSLRYSGALVGDFHRILLEGGLYFYPADGSQVEGKLRLLYECAPLALVAEQAGGAASTGRQRVLDIRPTKIHQRVPFAIGSREDVAQYEAAAS